MYEDISPGVGSLRTPKETVFVLLFFFFKRISTVLLRYCKSLVGIIVLPCGVLSYTNGCFLPVVTLPNGGLFWWR